MARQFGRFAASVAGVLGLTVPLCGAAAAPIGSAEAQLPALAPTPPMGWASWYGLRCNYDHAVLRQTAKAMVDLGLSAAGYRYLNVDDCWAVTRDPQDRLAPDPKRFPDGMAAIAREVHARGLKFGIYTSAGTTTCQRDLQADAQRLPVGSKGHEYRDARQFAELGADFVKVDWCGRYNTQDSRSSYETWRDAVAAAGRPMVLSICEWGFGEPWKWGKGVGHMWRLSMDTLNCWACSTGWGGIGVVQTFDRLAEHSESGGPNGWNDPDVLMVGNGALTRAEEQSQMSIYAIAAAPLIVAADLRRISKRSLAVLKNREVIAINQDPLGKPGQRIRQEDGEEVWVRQLSGGRRGLVLFNRSALPRTISVRWGELDLQTGARIETARELWSGRDVLIRDGVSATLPAHGSALYLLGPTMGSQVRAPI